MRLPISKKNIQKQLNIIDRIEFDFDFEDRSDILFYYSDSFLYILPTMHDVSADTNLYIFSYSTQNKKQDTITVKFPVEHLSWKYINYQEIRKAKSINEKEELQSDEYDFIKNSFAITEHYLVVSGADRILVFARDKNNFNFLYAITSEDIYGFKDYLFSHHLKITNDTLLAYRSHTIDAGTWGTFSSFAEKTADSQLVSTVIMKYHLENRKLIDFKIIYPEPKGLGFLNMSPRENIACNGKYYVISDVSEYNLYLYDTDWNLIDKISHNDTNWIQGKNLPDAVTVASAYKEHPKKSLDLMRPFTRKMSLIHNIFFKNAETISVSWASPNRSKDAPYVFDEFKIINGKLKWINTFEQVEVDKDSEELFSTVGAASALTLPYFYYIFDNHLVTISEEAPFDIFSNEIQTMRLKDYYQKLDNYFEDNSIKRSILIYKFKE